MEPQESTETATGRKGQIWKLFAYFLGLYVVTFAANQVVADGSYDGRVARGVRSVRTRNSP
jgi:hypothetical protein